MQPREEVFSGMIGTTLSDTFSFVRKVLAHKRWQSVVYSRQRCNAENSKHRVFMIN